MTKQAMQLRLTYSDACTEITLVEYVHSQSCDDMSQARECMIRKIVDYILTPDVAEGFTSMDDPDVTLLFSVGHQFTPETFLWLVKSMFETICVTWEYVPLDTEVPEEWIWESQGTGSACYFS